MAPRLATFVTQAQATHPLVGHSSHFPAGPAFSNMLPISVFSAQSRRDPLKTEVRAHLSSAQNFQWLPPPSGK